MKKSIFKRIVSAALALTMLASMAVGMSTSVSAASKPGDIKGVFLKSVKSTKSSKSVTISWGKASNATRYLVRLLDMTQKGSWDLPLYTDYYVSGTSCTLNNVDFVNHFKDGTYDIAITPFNGSVEGSTVKAFSYEDFQGYKPCISDVMKNTIKATKTSNSIKLTWSDTGIAMDHSSGGGHDIRNMIQPTQGYQITLTDITNKGNQKKTIRTTNSKSYTFKNLKSGHQYVVSFKSYVIGYAGKMILDVDTVNYNQVITLP